MSGPMPQESRRYAVPPLWSVPLLLIVAIVLVVLLGLSFGLLGLVPAGFAIVWLQRRADAYVRRRQQEADERTD